MRKKITEIAKLAKSLEELEFGAGLVIEVSFYENGSARMEISKEEFLQSFEIYDVHYHGTTIGISLFAVFQGVAFATSLNQRELEEIKETNPRHHKFITDQVNKFHGQK